VFAVRFSLDVKVKSSFFSPRPCYLDSWPVDCLSGPRTLNPLSLSNSRSYSFKFNPSLPHLAASYNVLEMYPFVPLTQYGVKKIMKMTIFLFSKFIRRPFFLAPKVFYRRGSKFPHSLSLLKRLKIDSENHLPVMAAVAVRKKVVNIGHFSPCFCLQSLKSFLFVRSNQRKIELSLMS